FKASRTQAVWSRIPGDEKSELLHSRFNVAVILGEGRLVLVSAVVTKELMSLVVVDLNIAARLKVSIDLPEKSIPVLHRADKLTTVNEVKVIFLKGPNFL